MYSLTWRNKFLTVNAKSIDEMIEMLQCAATELAMMEADGVFLQGDARDDYAHLVTILRNGSS